LRLPVINSSGFRLASRNRGGVIVFRLPAKPSIHYIKRLIDAGDHVAVRNNQVIINDLLLRKSPMGFLRAATSWAPICSSKRLALVST